MTNETRHTPTPWDTMGGIVIRVEGPTSYMVARASSSEDADHIVKCVNIHDELVEALRPIEDMEIILDKPDDEDICFVSYGTIKKIKEILKKAGAL